MQHKIRISYIAVEIVALIATSAVRVAGQTSPTRGAAVRKMRHANHSDIKHKLRVDGPFLLAWSHGAVLEVDYNPSDSPIIYGTDREGGTERIEFSIPDGRHITVTGLANGRDGDIGLIGSAYSNDGQATTFVARISPDRSQKIITRLWPYVPKVVAVASDRTIWTIGFVRRGEGVEANNVVKQFDYAGKLLKTFQTAAKSAPSPQRGGSEMSSLRSSNDRVAWLTNGDEYIEFSLDSRELTRIDGPPFDPVHSTSIGLAISDNNQVVVSAYDHGTTSIWALDREHRTWNPITFIDNAPPNWAQALGFDGNDVVIGTADILSRYQMVLERE